MNKFLVVVFSLLCFIGLNAQCFEDRHSTILEDSWISCQLKESPNPQRGMSHWIMYDLGDRHLLGQSHFWNLNAPGYEEMGARKILIDYSTAGSIWIEWGLIELDRADASGFYEGQSGPDFQGLDAQFVLITITESYGSDCAGLAEVRFESLGISTSTVDESFASSKLITSPNPAYDHTYLQLDSPLSFEATIRLLTTEGKEIYNQTAYISKGENSIKIEFGVLPPGNYIIVLEGESRRLSSQLSIINK